MCFTFKMVLVWGRVWTTPTSCMSKITPLLTKRYRQLFRSLFGVGDLKVCWSQVFRGDPSTKLRLLAAGDLFKVYGPNAGIIQGTRSRSSTSSIHGISVTYFSASKMAVLTGLPCCLHGSCNLFLPNHLAWPLAFTSSYFVPAMCLGIIYNSSIILWDLVQLLTEYK